MDERLAAEADWLLAAADASAALPDAAPGKVSAEYLRGFRAAAGWVRFHADRGRADG